MANITQIRVSGTTYTIVDSTAVHSLDGYSTTAQMNQAITAATDALAQDIAAAGYQTASDVQNAITGKVDTTAYTTFTAATEAALNDKLEESDVAGLFGAVSYDSETTRINFKHDATGETLAWIDASPFIKDGFLSSVTIVTVEDVDYLRFTWNTDAGIQVTDIALTNIFNPNNYYTKSDTDTLLAAKANTATTYTKTDVDDLLDDKQDTLVSATNIKTINGESVLGSGNIVINEGGTIDTAMSDNSENAVQNKVIKAYADTKNPMAYLDSETLVIS